MQDRGVQVVDVDGVLDRVHPQLVGRAVRHAALDAAAGQQHGEGRVVVVAAGLGLVAGSRRRGCGRTRRPR